MKKLFSFLILLAFFGCNGGKQKSSGDAARPPKKILTEAEKEKYITPTIYYVADYSNESCSTKTELNISISKSKTEKISVCEKTAKGCLLQGSCYVKYNEQKTMINYYKKINGIAHFKIVNTSLCPYGLGDSSDALASYKIMCLDPFRSVAADLSLYKLGDVVFIPAIVGVQLPDGTYHDGYFVVRDSGSDIDGKGRFDFFTGHLGLNASNPFLALGLGGGSNFDYYLVGDEEARLVRSRRGFPGLPAK